MNSTLTAFSDKWYSDEHTTRKFYRNMESQTQLLYVSTNTQKDESFGP